LKLEEACCAVPFWMELVLPAVGARASALEAWPIERVPPARLSRALTASASPRKMHRHFRERSLPRVWKPGTVKR
jgi:hypothetical protein